MSGFKILGIIYGIPGMKGWEFLFTPPQLSLPCIPLTSSTSR